MNFGQAFASAAANTETVDATLTPRCGALEVQTVINQQRIQKNIWSEDERSRQARKHILSQILDYHHRYLYSGLSLTGNHDVAPRHARRAPGIRVHRPRGHPRASVPLSRSELEAR